MMITVEMLAEKEACYEQFNLFKSEWPNGAKVTLKNCKRAAAIGLSMDWAAENLLTPTARAAYQQATATALAAYEQAMVTARAAREQAKATAWAAYEQATATAFYRACKLVTP